ncbi:DUF429 domain-containing protein [Guyparkeria hydrothermalis]|uniref:DUF429 domain-containing protein n=1 Tax=Guyparkeria TaxID=2035712 RepID=UPI0010AB6752|nr:MULTISPECIES: DUF429 domain-containing protein [Guyparkeria]MCL7750895.1 DUF429 domain-containing protein [Guyparkeria hydrothermalis]TKA90636.1 DUF429 domain-containing protein [Guyparkeria sp. SB14A]
MSEQWIVGIDGCPGGWVAIAQVEEQVDERGSTSTVRALVAPRLDDLLGKFADLRRVGIDMPIGLSDDEPRACDREARGLLGARGSSVFPAPLRPALAATTHAEASSLSRQSGGKGVSAQAWNLFAKVRELDELLSRDLAWRERVVEVHPELSFLAMNRGEPLPASKHRIEGIYRRRALIAEAFGSPAIDSAVTQLAGTRVKEDDMLDAFAVLWSARRHAAGAGACLPSDPPRDACGLPMRIVY